MDSQKAAEIANEKIKEWAKDVPKLVIGLDGYTGVGKTTLLNNLIATNPEILAVNRDDFLFTRPVVKEKLAKAEDKSVVFELEITNDQKLIDLVNAFRPSHVPSKSVRVSSSLPHAGQRRRGAARQC